MARYAFAALCLAALVLAAAAEVPSYIQVCGRNNPQLDKCVEDSVSKLTPRLKVGIPELDVPPLEPLEVERIPLAELPEFKAVSYNVKIRGLSQFIIKYLKVDLEKQKFDMDLLFPNVSLDADYDVSARILVPINEKGPINTISENVFAKASLKFQTLERRGRKLMYFPSMTMKLTLKAYKAKFMPGEENPITEAINSVLENSQQEIIDSMTPNLEKAISTKILELSNLICKHFTYDELFPDRT